MNAALIGILCLFAAISIGPAFAQIPPQAKLVVQLGQSGSIATATFSSDGHYVVTGGFDYTAVLWEAATGNELRTFRGHTDTVNAVAFSPGANFLLTGSADHTARLWNITTGAEIRQFVGHSDSIVSVRFSPDGKWVLTGSTDHSARIWDVETGKQVRVFAGHTDALTSVDFSSDGRTVLTGSSDHTMRLWDAATGKELRRFIRSDPVTSVALSFDSRYAVAGGGILPAVLYDTTTGVELRRFGGPVCNCRSAAFSKDGRFVLTGGPFALAEIWDAATGKEFKQIQGDSEIDTVAFSPDSRNALTAGHEPVAIIWDTSTAKEVRRLRGHAGAVTSAAFSPDGHHFLTGLNDSTARLWDGLTGKEEHSLEGHTNTVSSVAFSADGHEVLTGSYDGTARLWDTGTAKELKRLSPAQPGTSGPLGSMFGYIFSVSLSQDKKFALTGGLDNTAHLWNLSSGKEERSFVGHSDGISVVAFSPDGHRVLTGSLDKTARLWDTATAAEVRRFKGDSVGALAGIFSANGKMVFTSGPENAVHAWDTATGKELHRFIGHSLPVESIAVSANGRFVLTGSQDTTSRVWDTDTGAELKRLEGHSYTVGAVDISPDNRFALTGSTDSTARIWNLESGKELATLVSFRDDNWAVVDSVGRFDTSDLDGEAPLQWVLSDDPMHALPLEIFMREYYTPGLLATILKGQQDKLPQLRSIGEITNRVQPEVLITSAKPAHAPGRVDVVVHAARHIVPLYDMQGNPRKEANGQSLTQSSGLQDLRLFRDGQLVGSGSVNVNADCAGDGTKPRDVSGGYIEGALRDCDFTFHDVEIKSDAKKVVFTAYAFNSERIKSATASLDYEPERTAQPQPVQRRAYLLQIGVNHYAASRCDLNYSVADAEKMSEELAKRLKIQGYDVNAAVLKSAAGEDTQAAGKAAIRKQLAQIAAQATPDDVFVMSFSGHGYSAPDGEFYILPADIQGSCRTVDDALLKSAISANELAAWLRPIDSGELTLILDACFSAESVNAGDFKPGPLGSRGLGQLAYDKRMRVLAASQSDEVAHEYDSLHEGLLTYVLTHEGLDESKADWKPVDKKITMGEWLAYAANAVPKFVPPDQRKDSNTKAARRNDDVPGNTVIQIPVLFDFTKSDSLQLK
jgi:WD40 repeat protein